MKPRNDMRRFLNQMGRLVPACCLGAVLGLPVAALAQAPAPAADAATPASVPQRLFATPQEAEAALITAVQTDNVPALSALFGPQSEHMVASGDDVADRTARQAFVNRYNERHSLQAQPDGSIVLIVGADDWPMPIPLVQTASGWRFDTARGLQEVLDRRVGRNELSTIDVLRKVVAAQHDYAQRMQQEFGFPAYAERLISTPGTHDGLIWDTAEGEALSPLGAFALQQEAEGYPDAHVEVPGHPVPYHGYYFRMLTGQGPNARGEPGSYMRNGYMTKGFAMIAWPAHYGASGFMTFMVGPDGVVYQQNLGEDTPDDIRHINRYDPDANWEAVPAGGK